MGRISELLRPRLSGALLRRPRKGKAGPAEADAGDAAVHGIAILVDAGGWRVHTEGQGESRVGKAALPLQIRDRSELLKQLDDAIASIGPEERRQVQWIDLIISDPQIEVLDNRLIRGGLSDRESAARLSRDVLGRDESAFDVCKFRSGSDAGEDRKLIAAAPLDCVRDYLSATGDLATRVRMVCPVASTVISQASDNAGGAGLVEIGVRQSQIILADSNSGAIVQRVIPIGIGHLADKLAEAQSLSPDAALTMLSERDLFARLSNGSEDPDRRQSRSEAAVASVAQSLLRDLRRTLEDFSENRMADPPGVVALTGCCGEISGLEAWLQTGLDLKLDSGDATLPLSMPRLLNLLRGTNDALIVQGRTRYRFKDDRFVPVDDNPVPTPKQATNPKNRSKSKAGRKAAADSANQRSRNKRAMMFAGTAVCALLCFMAWDYVAAPAQARSERASSQLASTVDRSVSLRYRMDELRQTHQQSLQVRAQAGNKILWTEKFLAISQAIPPGLWLTETMIIQDERSVGTTDVITTKLRIRGETILNEQTNLPDIARFIQMLESDERFMSDFRKVTFEGLAPAGNGTLSFELHAWYDQNKRKNAGTGGVEAGGEGGALDKLKRTTDARSRMQDDILRRGPDRSGATQ